MSLATKLIVPFLAILLFGVEGKATPLRESLLRKYAIDFGLIMPEETWVEHKDTLVLIGKKIFETTVLSSNNDTACASCHLDRFGSADGLPTAVGVEGVGFGKARVLNGGDPLPRNALALWGRGGKGFDTLFWDGRVSKRQNGVIHSQFGDFPPSADPLVVAAHLPPLEVGEMVLDSVGSYAWYQKENLETASIFSKSIVNRLRQKTPIISLLAKELKVSEEEVAYTDVMAAAAHFIAFNYRLRQTKFHRFVFQSGALTQDELEGGLLFYGKGQCAHCHNGPYFSDFSFHVIPFPQFGFGSNGFGVDYGRYNVTQNPQDMYSFRTPPLYNVSKTSPYSHSGSVEDLKAAIEFHSDPLTALEKSGYKIHDKQQYARKLGFWVNSYPLASPLTSQDVINIAKFLKTLDYGSELSVKEINPQPEN